MVHIPHILTHLTGRSSARNARCVTEPYTTFPCRTHLPPFDARRRLHGRSLRVLDHIRRGTRRELDRQTSLAHTAFPPGSLDPGLSV